MRVVISRHAAGLPWRSTHPILAHWQTMFRKLHSITLVCVAALSCTEPPKEHGHATTTGALAHPVDTIRWTDSAPFYISKATYFLVRGTVATRKSEPLASARVVAHPFWDKKLVDAPYVSRGKCTGYQPLQPLPEATTDTTGHFTMYVITGNLHVRGCLSIDVHPRPDQPFAPTTASGIRFRTGDTVVVRLVVKSR